MQLRRTGVRITLLLVSGWAAGLACTNEYDDFAYQSESDATPGTNTCRSNRECAGDANCDNGVCSCLGGSACGAGETCCNPQGCRNLNSDPNHCGACGERCNLGLSCNNGSCTP